MICCIQNISSKRILSFIIFALIFQNRTIDLNYSLFYKRIVNYVCI